jgi:exopolysaccharide production protein ExoQ
MIRWCYFAAGFFLLQATGAFAVVDYWIYGPWASKTGDKYTQACNLLQIVVSLFLFIRAYRTRRRIGAGGILAIATVCFLILSAFWSVDPQTTARRGAIYLFIVIGAIGITGNLKVDEFMNLLSVTCFLSVIGSLVILAVLPDQGFMGDDFRGIFSHKNVLGEVMAAGVLASLHGIRGGRRQLCNAMVLILFTIVALASRSATSLMTIFFYCGISGIAILARKGGRARIFAIFSAIVLLPIVVIGAMFPDSLLELIGKDPTLTGRTELWTYVMGNIAQRPVLGWGFSAFWSPANPVAGEISSVLGWEVPEAHNGLLEILLEVGVIGTLCFVVIWARNVYLAIRCYRTAASELAISSLLCCGGILSVGITEKVLVDPSFGSVTVFFITGLMCERAVRAEKRRRWGSRRDYPTRPPANSGAWASRI